MNASEDNIFVFGANRLFCLLVTALLITAALILLIHSNQDFYFTALVVILLLSRGFILFLRNLLPTPANNG